MSEKYYKEACREQIEQIPEAGHFTEDDGENPKAGQNHIKNLLEVVQNQEFGQDCVFKLGEENDGFEKDAYRD